MQVTGSCLDGQAPIDTKRQPKGVVKPDIALTPQTRQFLCLESGVGLTPSWPGCRVNTGAASIVASFSHAGGSALRILRLAAIRCQRRI